MNAYRPIDCDYYDRLESWAVKKEKVTIKYSDGKGEKEIMGIIKDFETRDHAEYLKLDNGTEIRLDTLISVNDIPLPRRSASGGA